MKNHRTLFLSLIFLWGYSSNVLGQQSINLNGTTDYIAVPNDPSLAIAGDFTIEAWIKPNDISGEKTILIKGNNSQCGNYGLFIKDGNLAFVSDGDCNWAVSRGANAVLQVGVWQHVAAVSNGNNVQLFINGSLTDTLVRNAAAGAVNSDALWIGRSVFGTTNFLFDGLLDEVRIWDVSRTQSELQNGLDTELSGLENNLLAYYKLDDVNPVCDVSDCSSNENHGSRSTTDGSANVPEYDTDFPTGLTDVACGVTFSNCSSFQTEFQSFADEVLLNLEEGNRTDFLNEEAQVASAIADLQYYYANRAQIVDEFYDFLADLCTIYPQFFKINQTFDDVQFKFLGSFREQVHIYLRDYLRDYPGKEAQFLSALDLTNSNASGYLKIWDDHGILIVDNYSLSPLQLTFIDNLLATIPDTITNLGVVMYREFYTNDYASAIYTTQSVSFINSFGDPIGAWIGNGFPDGFTSYNSDQFSITLSHEICHTIDYDYVLFNSRLNTWKGALLSAAGTTYNEYLRTKVLDIGGNDFFQVSPQEFFASLANVYFSNSALTLDLAIDRFNQGFKQPINQFLLMADALSAEGNQTHFYVIDTNSNIELTAYDIERNSAGFISAIQFEGAGRIEFEYDANDFVTEITNIKDDDGDGVLDDLDECPNTLAGQAVDGRGCEVFSFDAFKIYTESSGCPGVDSGFIEVTVSEETNGYYFDVQLSGNGVDLSFDDTLKYNTPLRINDLPPGTYSITVTLDEGYQNQFEGVNIPESEDLSADKTRVDVNSNTAYYKVAGNTSYTAIVNGNPFYYNVDTPKESAIAIPLEEGENFIRIQGADCQSVFMDQLTLRRVTFYPNPVSEGFYLQAGMEGLINLYNASGSLLKTIRPTASTEKYINIQEFPPGIYFLKFTGANTNPLKLIKE